MSEKACNFSAASSSGLVPYRGEGIKLMNTTDLCARYEVLPSDEVNVSSESSPDEIYHEDQ